MAYELRNKSRGQKIPCFRSYDTQQRRYGSDESAYGNRTNGGNSHTSEGENDSNPSAAPARYDDF